MTRTPGYQRNTSFLVWPRDSLTRQDVRILQRGLERQTLDIFNIFRRRDNTVFWGRPWDITRTCGDKNLILARRLKIWRSRDVSRCLWRQKLDVFDETSGCKDPGSLSYSLSLRFGNKLYFSLRTSCFIKTGVETIMTRTGFTAQKLRWDSTAWFTSAD